MNKVRAALTQAILEEWDREVPVEVVTAATAIAAKYGNAVQAVLFYGSCLRTGEIEDKILDFYLIVDSYVNAYNNTLLAVGNKICPPNVFYHEMDVAGLIVRSKYAIVSREDFAARVLPSSLNVSIWARFCQPCIALNPVSKGVEAGLASDISHAITTMLSATKPLLPPVTDSERLWIASFEQTYGAELRSEPEGKGREIYELDKARYDALSPLAFQLIGLGATNATVMHHQPNRGPVFAAKAKWMLRRWNGKTVSFLRLIKATFTFDAGIDYIAWKIRRHSGVEIEVKDWMRRHPIVAGVVLFWSARKKGAFK